MIDELGAPDDHCENPHYPRGPLASLYRVERVEAWVAANPDRLEQAQVNRAKRSAAMKNAYERKQAAAEAAWKRKMAERERQIERWRKDVHIELQRPLGPTLAKDARQHYAFGKETDPLKQKALRAYVRDYLTNFLTFRRQLRGHEFEYEILHLLRDRVDAVIQPALEEWKRTYWEPQQVA